MKYALAPLGIVIALFFAACSNNQVPVADQYLGGRAGNHAAHTNSNSADGYDPDSYWDAAGVAGEPRIVINLREQKAYYYHGTTLVGRSRISTGREGQDTPPGNYRVIGKSRDHVSNLWGNFVDDSGRIVQSSVSVRRHTPPPGTRFVGSPMPYFIRLTNSGIGLHAGYLPGYPASAGCIRMPKFMAEKFFENTELGTPVTIVR